MVCFVFTFWKRTSCVQSFYIRSLNCKQFIRKHELHFGLRCKISIHWILVGKAKWYFELKLDALMLWRMDISLQRGYILKASIKYTIYKIFEHLVSSTNATIMIRQCIRFILLLLPLARCRNHKPKTATREPGQIYFHLVMHTSSAYIVQLYKYILHRVNVCKMFIWRCVGRSVVNARCNSFV